MACHRSLHADQLRFHLHAGGSTYTTPANDDECKDILMGRMQTTGDHQSQLKQRWLPSWVGVK